MKRKELAFEVGTLRSLEFLSAATPQHAFEAAGGYREAAVDGDQYLWGHNI